MAASNPQPKHPFRSRRGRAACRRVESLLSDPKGWPAENAPLRVRTRVLSSLAAQRQQVASGERVTMYQDSGRWSRRRLYFSLRPPLAAAAVVAMIISATIHFMGGTQAWQPWADGISNQPSYSGSGTSGFGSSLADAGKPGDEIGRSEVEALFTDMRRFRAHISGRLPAAIERDATPPPASQPPQRPTPGSDPASQ
ncbi:MAG: hypothetical protein KIT54_07500 [Phycisphaeraceae bacterium]|nr:hypothetical protein [Phycisphaeraceae bacterium]